MYLCHSLVWEFDKNTKSLLDILYIICIKYIYIFKIYIYIPTWISQATLVVKNLPANARDVRDAGSVPGSGRSPRGGHRKPLQYSYLENPMENGASWAEVRGVTKSQTQLKWLSTAPLCLLRHVWLFAAPWTAALQAPLSMGFPRQEYWSGLPFPSPGELPDPGIQPMSPALQVDSLPLNYLGHLHLYIHMILKNYIFSHIHIFVKSHLRDYLWFEGLHVPLVKSLWLSYWWLFYLSKNVEVIVMLF